MGRPTQTDWAPVRQEYLQNSTVTAQGLADKYHLSVYAVRHKIEREKWARARESYIAKYQERIAQLAIRTDAPAMLRALNEKQLKQCEELRGLLNVKLKEEVNIIEVRCAVAAFAEIYRMERLCLGASTDNLAVASTQASRYDEMTEEQLLEELKQVRERVAIN